MQPFDVSKLKNYDKIVGIFKDGKLTTNVKDRPRHGAAHGRLRGIAGFQKLRLE